MTRKGLITSLLMFTLMCSLQTIRPHEQEEHIPGGTAKRSELRAFSRGRKILEKKIKESEKKESERDKDRMKRYDKYIVNESRGFKALLKLLNEDCFDEEPLTKKISKLEQNKGFFSWFDRGRKPFGGFFRILYNMSFMSYDRDYDFLMNKKFLNDRTVDKALEVALENLQSIDKKDYQRAFALCREKGYSEFGCKNVLNAYTGLWENRRRATKKQRYGKNVSVSRTSGDLTSFLYCVKSMLIDNLIIVGPPAIIGFGFLKWFSQ